MKITRIIYLFLIAFISSCSDDEVEHFVDIKGRIVNELSNEGVENAPISIYSKEYYSSYGGGHLDIDHNTGITDINGYFSLSLKYSNKEDSRFTFYSGDEFNITDILGHSDRFLFDTATSGDLIFKVRGKAKLKITLKNINPFDENDSIKFNVFQDLGYNPKVYEINNFGVENYFIENYPMNTHWVGMDVNSTIFSTLEEGHTYRLFIYITKDGIETNYLTPEFEIDLTNLNEYTLNF